MTSLPQSRLNLVSFLILKPFPGPMKHFLDGLILNIREAFIPDWTDISNTLVNSKRPATNEWNNNIPDRLGRKVGCIRRNPWRLELSAFKILWPQIIDGEFLPWSLVSNMSHEASFCAIITVWNKVTLCILYLNES